MKKKLIGLGLVLIFICIGVLAIKITMEHKKYTMIEEITTSLLKDDYFQTYISKPTLSLTDHEIVISFQLDKSYNLLPTSEKFILFDLYSKQIRYFLRTNERKNTLHDFDITLKGNISEYDYTYTLTSTLPHKYEFLKPDNVLLLNGTEIYDTERNNNDVKNTKSNSEETTKNGHKHTEILSYSERLYNTMTKRGKNFKPNTDSLLIVEAVMKEFDITFEEYDYIYKKNILNID